MGAQASSTDGGYDFDFVEDIPDDFLCVVCHMALKKPVQVIECGHKFCEICFEKMKTYSQSSAFDLCCPIDRDIIDPAKVFPDKYMERKVQDLQVYCINKAKNCEWTGDLRSLQDHLLKSCLYEEVSCQYCEVKIERGKLNDHLLSCEKKVDGRIAELITKLSKMNEDKFLGIVNEQNEKLSSLEKNMLDKKNELEACHNRINQQEGELKACHNRIDKQDEELKACRKNICQQDGELKAYHKRITLQDEEFIACHKQNNQLDEELKTCHKRINQQDEELKACHKRMDQQGKTMNKLEKMIEEIENNVSKQDELKIVNQLHNLDEVFKEHKAQFASLKVTMDVLSNDYPVFRWCITNYSKINKNEDLYSPYFYTSLMGFKVYLMARWSGQQKGRLGMYLGVKSTQYGDGLTQPFKKSFTLECIGKDGLKVTKAGLAGEWNGKITCDQGHTGDNTEQGVTQFMLWPEIKKCLINDCLTIKCWFS